MTCSATGKRVLPTATIPCPVSNEKLIERAAVECEQCKMPVHPREVETGDCGACRGLVSVRKNDARLARILGEYPELDRWRKWKLYESETKYWISASGWMSRIVIVLDHESLQIESMAKSPRLRRLWKAIPPERYEDELKR